VTTPNSTATVLVVEDEPEIRGILRRVLEELGVRVTEAATGAEGIALAERERPDLVVLDLGLPDVRGDDVCRAVRASPNVGHVPIVVVSARHSEEEKVRLLDAGADDYLTKPFGSAELAARVRAHLRRAQRADTSAPALPALRLGDLALDLVNRDATRGETPVHLTPIEWGLLKALAAEPGRTLTHQQLFEAVWRREYGNAAQYLRVHVTNLRRKVEPNPSLPVYIVTEPGVGYRLELPT
jgi:two-component system KDP operon response regulator KdpE